MAQSPGFYVYSHKGFQVVFSNGWEISVMFGFDNYCSQRYNKSIKPWVEESPSLEFVFKKIGSGHSSPDAEVAVFKPNGECCKDFPFLEPESQHLGRVSPDKMLAIMAWTAAQPPVVLP
jgi:hypothetical protein